MCLGGHAGEKTGWVGCSGMVNACVALANTAGGREPDSRPELCCMRARCLRKRPSLPPPGTPRHAALPAGAAGGAGRALRERLPGVGPNPHQRLCGRQVRCCCCCRCCCSSLPPPPSPAQPVHWPGPAASADTAINQSCPPRSALTPSPPSFPPPPICCSGAYNLYALADHLHRRGLYRNMFEAIHSLDGQPQLRELSPTYLLRSGWQRRVQGGRRVGF